MNFDKNQFSTTKVHFSTSQTSHFTYTTEIQQIKREVEAQFQPHTNITNITKREK